MSVFYGIDVGGTTVKIGRFEAGELTGRFELSTDTSCGGRHILPDIANALRGAADGAGLGVPGPVLPDGTVNRCHNLGWDVCRPGEALQALTGIPVRVCNDADAAALGECWRGSGRGFGSVLTVTLGTGVGAGFVWDGKILSGAHGAAGEIGHICLNPDETEPCTCGNRGCLEQLAGARGITALAQRAGLGPLSAKELFSMAAAGDEKALSVTDRACDALGRGLAAACAALDPEAVLLGGGVARAGEFLRVGVEKAYRRYAFHACRDTKILLASLGPDAGLYGCARLAMEEAWG